MGMIKQSFGWLLGLKGTAIDDIDVKALAESSRGVQLLEKKWEREMRAAQNEYDGLMDADSNLRKSKIEIRLSLKKARISARKLRMYEKMLLLLGRMRNVAEEVKVLKEYAGDLEKSGQLKPGVKLGDLRGELDRLGLVIDEGTKGIDVLQDGLDMAEQAMTSLDDSPVVEDDVIVELFEKLQTLKADGKADTEEAKELQEQIDHSMGISVAN